MKAGDAERDYLGRIAQGYFAFHMLGAFGSVVAERLLDAENTIWLLDSSLQIHALALASSLNLVFKDCFSRLRKLGIRLFTTKKLFDEVIDHLWFANRIITEYGQNSYHVIAAARNDAPYPKSNVFLEGYIRWHALGKTNEWESYLYQIFGITNLFENKHLTEEELIKIQVV